MQVILWGGGLACAYEHILDYTNNPGNILNPHFALFHQSDLYQILGSVRSDPIFPISLFWSKLKNAFKYVKLALEHQIIKRGGFFFNTLYFGRWFDTLLDTGK